MRKVCFLKPQLYTRLEFTEDMNVSVGEPHSRTSFKTESETSSFVSIYRKRDMPPFPYLTRAHTELLSHKVSSKTLREDNKDQTLQNDNQEFITHNPMHVILKVEGFLNCNLYIPIQ